MNICFDWWHPIVYYQCWPTSLQKCLVIVLFSRGHWVSVSVLLLMFGGWHLLAHKKHSSRKRVPVRDSFIVSCSLKALLGNNCTLPSALLADILSRSHHFSSEEIASFWMVSSYMVLKDWIHKKHTVVVLFFLFIINIEQVLL